MKVMIIVQSVQTIITKNYSRKKHHLIQMLHMNQIEKTLKEYQRFLLINHLKRLKIKPPKTIRQILKVLQKW